jgi:hypothetical protein
MVDWMFLLLKMNLHSIDFWSMKTGFIITSLSCMFRIIRFIMISWIINEIFRKTSM